MIRIWLSLMGMSCEAWVWVWRTEPGAVPMLHVKALRVVGNWISKNEPEVCSRDQCTQAITIRRSYEATACEISLRGNGTAQ